MGGIANGWLTSRAARSRIALGVVLGLLSTLLASFEAPAFAAPPPSGTIVYIKTDPETQMERAFAANVAGETWKLTGNHGQGERAASLSPDGKRVAIVHQCSNCVRNNHVAVYDLYADQPKWSRFVASGTFTESVSWSPDGTKLAVANSGSSVGSRILIFPADGSTDGTVLATFPVAAPVRTVKWSPTGDRIGYVRQNSSPGSYEFGVVDFAAGQSRVLDTTASTWGGSNFGWADANHILYAYTVLNFNTGTFSQAELRKAAADGSTSPTVIHQEPPGQRFYLRSVSADGNWFVSGTSTPLKIRPVDGSQAAQDFPPATASDSRESATWSAVTLPAPGAPVPTVTANGLNGPVNLGEPITFAARSADGSATKVEVNWGDGTVETFPLTNSPSSTNTISHTYTTAAGWPIKITALAADDTRGNEINYSAYVFDIKMTVTPSTVRAGETATVDFSDSTMPLPVSGVRIAGAGAPTPLESSSLTFDVTFGEVASGDLLGYLKVNNAAVGGAREVGPESVPITVKEPGQKGTLLFPRQDPDSGGAVRAYASSLDGDFWRLTDADFFAEQSPTLSPDGTKVALVHECVTSCSNGGQVAVYNLYGSQPVWARAPLASLSHAFSVDWSPDGESLAVASRTPDNLVISVMPADGSAPGTVVASLTKTKSIRLVRWSPDGTRIGFSRGVQTSTGVEFGSVNVATGVVNILAATEQGWAGRNFEWSSDGQALLYGHTTHDGNTNQFTRSQLRRVAVVGSSPPTTVYEDPENKMFVLRVISPDGKWFVSGRTPAGLQIARVDASEGPAPFPDPIAYAFSEPSWDGATIAPPPTPNIEVSGLFKYVNVGTPVSFEARTFDGTARKVEVDWGDGQVQRVALNAQGSAFPQHTYTQAGSLTMRVRGVGPGGRRGAYVDYPVFVFDVKVEVTPSSLVQGDTATVDLSGSTMPIVPSGVTIHHGASPTPTESQSLTFDTTFEGTGRGELLAYLNIQDGDGIYQVGPGRTYVGVNRPITGPGGIVTSFQGDLFVYPDAAPTPYWQITFGPGQDRNANFDETGSRVVFERDGDIWMVDNDGRDLRRLTNTPELEAFPDLHGDTVVYTRYAPHGSPTARMIRADVGSPSVQSVIPVDTTRSFGYLEFTPSGKAVRYTDQLTLRRVALGGGGDLVLYNSGDTAMYFPDWSADGKKVLVAMNSNIVEIDLAAGTKRTVTNKAENGNAGLSTPHYSPDGERIAYTASGGGGSIRTRPLGTGEVQPFDSGSVSDWWVAGSEDKDPVFIVTGGGTGQPIDDGCNPAPGDCTLPEAIIDNNGVTTGGGSTTDTRIIVPPGTTIDPTTPLPKITRPVTLTGDLEPGDDFDPYRGNCGPKSYLMGDKAAKGSVGLTIDVGRQAARTTLVRGFNIVRWAGDGLRIRNSAKVRLLCLASGSAGNYPQPSDANRGDGFDVKDSLDVVLYPSVFAHWNGSDGLEITGRSRRVRSLGAGFMDNGGLGIDLGKSGVDANDPGDADVGPNGLVNRPTVLRVRPTQNPFQDRIFIKVNHDPVAQPFRVDVFLNAWCDRSGSGEAIQWIGAGVFGSGTSNAKRVVRVDLPFAVPTYLLTATVTNGSGTSELAGCRHRDTDADPDLDGTGATQPTTTITPGTGNPGGGGSDSSSGDGDIRDNGTDDGGPGSTTDGDNDGGNDDVSGGDQPNPDTSPAPEGYVVVGPTGEVTVDKPGLLDGLAGDGPLQAIKETGGDMPFAKWSLTASGVVTMDATSLAPGTYYGRYSVVDRDGDRAGPVVIIFVVLNDKGNVVGTKDDPPLKAKPRADTYVVEPGRDYTFAGKNSVLSNDRRGSESNLTATLVSAGPLGSARLKLLADGTITLKMSGVAEGTYQATYRLRASGLDRGTTTITVVVDNHNACPIARDDVYELVAGDIFRVPAARGALSNDSDPENGAFTAKLKGSFGPNDIDFRKDGSIYLDARKASQTIATHREFSYWAVDAHGEFCGLATVRLNITPNTPPIANLDYYEVFAGQNFAVPARGVLGNDIDPDGAEVKLTAKKYSGNPAVTVGSDGSVAFSVPSNAPIDRVYNPHYLVTDEIGGTAIGEIRFRVVAKGRQTPIPKRPVVKDDLFYRVHADSSLFILPSNGVLANDSDPDGEGIFAEGLSEGEGRFTIERDGTFNFRPRLADVGATFTQKYYAVKKGYSAVRSANVATVSIQVVAPRVRCTSATQGVDLKAYDDGSNPSTLVDGSADWTFCWDKTNITDGWFGKPDDPIDYDTSSSLGVADTVFVGFKVKGVSNSQKTSFDRYPQQKRAEMSVSTEYNMCFDGAEFMTAAVGGLAKAFETPIIGKAIQSLAKRFDDKLPQKILDLIVATRKKLDGIPGGGFAAAAIEKLPWVGAIFKNVNSHEGRMRKVLKFIQNQTVKVAYDKSGVGNFTGRLSLAGIVNLIAEKGLSFGDLKIFAESFSCGTFMQELFDSYAPASGSSTVDVRVDGQVKARTAAIDGPYGFFEWFANWVWLFDLTRNGDVSLAWEPKELEDGGTLYRTCDFTRTSANDTPNPGDKIPGKPLVPCTDPSRRQ